VPRPLTGRLSRTYRSSAQRPCADLVRLQPQDKRKNAGLRGPGLEMQTVWSQLLWSGPAQIQVFYPDGCSCKPAVATCQTMRVLFSLTTERCRAPSKSSWCQPKASCHTCSSVCPRQRKDRTTNEELEPNRRSKRTHPHYKKLGFRRRPEHVLKHETHPPPQQNRAEPNPVKSD
jgi:hypothetical protein